MPLYGNALNLILSGVLVPVPPAEGGLRLLPFENELLGEPSVVLRVACVVSAEGGGGSEANDGSGPCEVRRDDRQRKHSPLP